MALLEFEGDTTFTLVFDNVSGAGSGGTGGYPIASQAEAEAGITNTSLMTPLRTHQAIDARIATDAEAAAGISTTTLITPAHLHAAVPEPAAALWFFDWAGQLLGVTVPTGVDVIYRLGYYRRGDHEITRFKRKAVNPTTAPTNNLAWEKDASGVYFVNDMPRIDCRTMGVVLDGQQLNGSGVADTMTAGSARLTLPGANFTAADVGKWVQVNGAGTMVENSSTVPPGTGHDLVWTDWLTGKIGTFANSAAVDLVDGAGAPLLATQTVTAAEAKAVFWASDTTDQFKNAHRAAATMKKFVYVPGGEFFALSNKSLCGINGYSNIRVEGDGPTSRIVHGQAQVPGDGSMYYIIGSVIERAHLTVPSPVGPYPLANTAGQDVIEVSATDFMPVDSYVALRDRMQPLFMQDQEDPNGLFIGYKGEIVHIREKLDATHFKLHAVLEETYTANQTAGQTCDVRAIVPQADCTFRNISLDLSKPMTTTDTGIINTQRTLRLTVDNVFFPHTVNGVSTAMFVDTVVRNSRFEWIGMLDGMQADGDHDKNKAYGIIVTSGARGGLFHNCIGRNVRHFCTASSASDIPPKGCMFSSITVDEGRVLLDTHPGADYWTVVDCHLRGGLWMDEVQQYGGGIQIRGNHNDVLNSSALGVAIGLQGVFIEGLRVHGFKADKCKVGVSIYNCRDTEILNTRVTDCEHIGFYWHWGLAGDPLQRFGYLRIKGFRMHGNPTQKTTVPDYTCNQPCGMQFGYWDGIDTVTPPFTATFTPQWFDGITIDDWYMPDCVTPFMGADHEAVYGAGILDVATAQNLSREEVETAGIAALTSGTLFLSGINLQKGRRIAKVGIPFATAGAGQTALWFGLFDKRRLPLSLSNDLGATPPSTTAVTFGTLARLHVTQYEGRHYIAACQVAATPSQVYGTSIAAPFAAQSPALGGNSNTGLTTPASYPQISSATSTTLLVASLQFPVMDMVTQAGKAFTYGMRVKIALTASPSTDYFLGTVTSYAGTALLVNCNAMVGLVALPPASLNAWTITADAAAAAITATGNLAFVVTA